VNITPNLAATPKRRVAALLYDGLGTFEFAIATEVFGLDRPEFGDDWYAFSSCSEGQRPVRANGHVSIAPEAGLEALASAGTTIIPAWKTTGEPASPAIADAMRQAHANGARLATICSGVFLLASLGLVNGQRVTTHWRYADRLRSLFPAVEVDPDVLYIDNGNILTSAGSAAGIDLLLHIVRKDFGPDRANQVARRLVMPPHRDGGQAQFIERPMPRQANSKLAALLDAVRARPQDGWTIGRMARQAAMSERTMIRRFKDGLGTSPGEWLVETRVDAARQLLEAGSVGIDEVAQISGFGSAATLRHHFRNRLGVSPARYRDRFLRNAP
jgi:AraC family transcriptional activator FtrA